MNTYILSSKDSAETDSFQDSDPNGFYDSDRNGGTYLCCNLFLRSYTRLNIDRHDYLYLLLSDTHMHQPKWKECESNRRYQVHDACVRMCRLWQMRILTWVDVCVDTSKLLTSVMCHVTHTILDRLHISIVDDETNQN